MIIRNEELKTRENPRGFFFIRNLSQALYFIKEGVEVKDIRLEFSKKVRKNRLTIVFARDNKSNKVFDTWCEEGGVSLLEDNTQECVYIKNITKNIFLLQNNCELLEFAIDDNNNVWFGYKKGRYLSICLKTYKEEIQGV